MSDLVYWVLLNSVPRLGPVKMHRLLKHFDGPRDVVEAPAEELSECGVLSEEQVGAILEAAEHLGEIDEWVERLTDEGVELLTWDDPDYPPHLRSIRSAPPLLYVRGELLPEEPRVAIIGTRQPTDEGREMAREMAAAVVEHGAEVVSGLAEGIDSAAHEGALEAGGRTVGVLPCGIFRVHPRSNEGLAERIASSGAVVSDFEPRQRSSIGSLMARNRIVTGLSGAVIVVETSGSGGTRNAVETAGKQGRPVYAVQTDADTEQAAATRALIEGGATALRGMEDVEAVMGNLAEAEAAAEEAEDPPTTEQMKLF
ncbi:MAG: DNA-processing protein DprA [Armatimonadota bacterium]|jgi:DNA processing protein